MAVGTSFSFLGKALGGIGEYLVVPISRQFGYLFCFNTNIQNLETQLDSLMVTREWVEDEARYNVRTVGPHLEAWLTKANDNTAEAETIIKDKAQVQKGCFNGWCPNLKLRYSLGRKAVKKTQELALLHAEGSNYIRPSYNPLSPSIEPMSTTTEFRGFDSRILVMNEIIEALKDDGIHLIGICGMGGVGKTTMAIEVAKRTENLFNEIAMATVTQEPNLKQVQSCIAEMLGLKLNMENPIERSSRLYERLLQKDKKILVILDDVWEEFDLEELGFPLEGGSNKSCKILFTSRNQNLWKGIQNKRNIELQVLMGDESWHLLREKVGDCADDLDLLPLAKDIVNECGGLPLALVTMGRSLRNEHNQYHWNDALRQLRTPCSESSSSEVPAKVYQALYFSYNFLKDERAKQLFLLCCLFPEDYNIPIEHLVRYGIGLRWFEGIEKVDEVRDRVYVLVDQLKSCYLLLDSSGEEHIKMHDVVRNVAISIAAKDKHGFMTIHGAKSREWPKKAIYELSTSISVMSNEIVEFPGGLRCSKLEFLLIRCWNSSLKIPSNFFEGMGELKVLDLAITKDISLLPSSLQFLSNLLTLHLDEHQNFDNISVIGKLLNLEILCFRDSDIEELPKEIGRLVNLKLLDLTRCFVLERIAAGVISALVQLQELYMVGCQIIWEPEGKEGGENASLREFESLSNLNTLEINIDGVECLPRIPLFSKLTKYSICIGSDDYNTFDDAEHITSFGNLLKLRGRRTIPVECVNSLLRSSAVLELRGMGSNDAVQESFREGVEGLRHLKELVIDDCATPECFVNTMEWVPRTPNAIPPIFPILEKLQLSSLPNLRKICHCQLPTGSFGKLKHLRIYNCDRMEEVIWEEKGEDDATNKMEFPALESMTLEFLPMLIGFCRGTGEIEFPQLKKLSLRCLPQLKWLFLKVALPSLEKLKLVDLDNLEGLEHIPISVDSFSKLRKLHVEHCGKWLCVFPSQFLTRLRNLEDLTVENFSLLEKVFELEMVDCKGQELEMLSLLKSLKLKHLPQLDYISKRDPIGFTYIPQLSILHVHDCDNLRYLFPLSIMKCMLQLQELDIRRCRMMSMIVADEKRQGKSSVDKIEFTQLKILRLYDLPNLVSFFPKVIATSATSTKRLQNVMQTLFNEKATFPSLEELDLHGFQNMNEIWCNQFQTGSFNKLFSLCVSDCRSLKNMFSPFMARHLVHLKRLVVIKCSMMEEVVAKEEDEEEGRINRTPLPKLKYLKLKDLPELKSFCHVTHDWELPLVDDVTVLNCPKMKTFSHGVICTPKLQRVFVKERMHKWYRGREGEDWLWIIDLNQTILHLIEKELSLHLAEGSNYIQPSYNPPPPSIEPIPTTTEFRGFDSRILVMNEIIEALKDDGIHLIGIYGMGGMGKTTMAKEVAKRTKNLFNEFTMAVVSQEPDLTKVQGGIADMLDFKEIKNRESLIARANLLRKRLLLDNKKILVILDDIWEEFDLEESGFPLEGGCKILFTSRNRNLWKGIQNKRYIQLQVLAGEEPWHLFREKVGDCADDLDLLPLAKQIVNECGGLPLALVTIGRALTNEHNKRHWNNALRQLRTPCSESLLSEVPVEVYQALYFSYNFLKDERAKKLFLHCCLFPEDCAISIEDLVRYGIGLRWFEGIDKVDEIRDRVNVLVDQLKSCYLLLDGCLEGWIKMHDVVRDVAISIAAKDKHGFMTIHGAKSREWPEKATYELNTSISVISNEIAEFPGGLRCSKLEFLLIQCWNSSLKIPSNFFEGMGELKVLDLAITGDISLLPSSLQFLSNLLTLHLDQCQKFDNISVIGKLLNLEILCFRGSDIQELPEEIGGLVNLKLLDLTRCIELKRIAAGVISALVQLQELYMVDCGFIWEPEGEEGGENASLREFESLSSLNTLEINIEDVECLPRIPLFSKLTKYSICIGCDVVGPFDAEQITSFGKVLKLCGSCTIPLECVNSLLRSSAVLELRAMGSVDVVQELFREGVEGLQHLKDLVIDDCAAPECFVNTMEWVPRTHNAIPPIFPILEKLQLSFLPNVRKICHCQLPTGSFGKLKHLDIRNCDRMEEVIWKEKGEDDATNKMEFPALESMTLFSLPMLICFCRGTDEIEFPQLKKLRLWDLPQLKWLFLNSSNPFSESMENQSATFLSLFPHKVALPSLEELKLEDLENLEGLEHIPQSSILHIDGCDNLRFLFKQSMTQCIQQLQELEIRECKMMSAIVREEGSQGEILVDNIEFTQLKILKLYDLQNLVSIFPKVTSAVATSFEHIPNSGQSLFNEKVTFRSLEELDLHGFQNMNEIWCNQLQTGSFNKLFSLYVSDCGSLRNMFSPFMVRHLVHLKRLVIIKCSTMEEVVGKEEDEEEEGRINRTPLPKLEYLKLKDLPELKRFCHVTHDWELPLVDDVTVLNCPKMKTFSHGVICTPKLQRVFVKEGMYKWYPGREGEDWLWINDFNQTILHLIEKRRQDPMEARRTQQQRRQQREELHPIRFDFLSLNQVDNLNLGQNSTSIFKLKTS